MYLKKLEVQGFKSFPEYTLIEFDQGMTAVVGPNGSGKSNVTDAIRWVLGEQSVKSLRGGKMEDVIFNGTQSRKAMNYAEVSLTLDNSDRFVDSDYSEIQITRRLYRSGESEYQINHVNCRLKDIVGMFLDTGMGKDGYSIVGQGRVDEVLSTKSEDRRRIIEEASGIVKYKVRKDEAERKLNSTEQNLIRIDDILSEISERIGPLKEQSEKAVKYHKAYEELKAKDIALMVRKIDVANEAMGDSASVKEKLEEEIKTQEDRYIALRNSNSELTSRADELEEKIEDKRQELSDITEEIHDLTSDKRISEERLNQLREKIEKSVNDEAEYNAEAEKLLKDYNERLGKSDELLSQADEFTRKADKLASERDELLDEFRKSERSQDDIRKNIDSKTNELIDTRDRINSSENQIASFDEKIRELSSNNEISKKLIEEMSSKLSEADELWRSMMQQEGDVTSDIAARDEKLLQLKKKESKLLSSYETDNRNYLSQKARHKTLAELEKRKEGYQESVRRLMNHVDSIPKLKKGIIGVVGDLLSTKKEYETAIEIALGSSIHNVVTETESDAADLIRELKENRLGRVTFLPIENIRPRELDSSSESKARGKKGYIGIASDLVDYDRKIADIVSNLLGKIIICEDMESARSIASTLNHSVKVISLEGDCINPGGSLTGGSVRQNAGGILGRAREIEELERTISDLEKALSVTEAERQQLDEEIGDISREKAQLEEQLKYFSLERVKAEGEYRNLANKIEESKAALEASEKQITAISSDRLRVVDDLEELKLIADETETALADFRESIVKNDNESKDFGEKLEKLREDITEAKTSAERIIAERNGQLQMAELIKSEMEKRRSSAVSVASERKEFIDQSDECSKQIEESTRKIAEMNVKGRTLQDEISELNQNKSEVDKELSGFVTKITDINDEINTLRNKLNNLVSRYERYINDIDFSKNRLWEDYETTYDNVKGVYPEITDQAAASRDISKLKSEIKSLGPVNLNSVDEYKEISERFEFMTSQRNDIAAAKANLEKVISDLITEMKQQFIEHFDIINENFKTVFTDLFNGGTAEILLGDEEDVLNCAIEIKAQPPGKKLQNLTLLSGGERCLTAIALLFAIQQLRPSPFVVLDEVEAALDDVNVTRFTDFVRRYTAKTQFIIVTHRKGTMEACDRMYGVTMQERGISKILSMRLGDNA